MRNGAKEKENLFLVERIIHLAKPTRKLLCKLRAKVLKIVLGPIFLENVMDILVHNLNHFELGIC